MTNTSLTTLAFLVSCFVLSAQSRIITGTVTDKQNEALPGTSILVKNTQLGTTTGVEGDFRLEVPAGYNDLIFSFVGFELFELTLDERSVYNIQLSTGGSYLDEVVVVGFGDQSKRRLTSAVASAGEEVFKNIPVSDVQKALQGRLPGVVISNSSGLINSDVGIRIRGVGSISAGNQPLFVVDGIVLARRVDAPYYAFGGYATNPLINLNSNDIASVEVLKDAAASAVYGARASNGVILITTKRGIYNSLPKVHLGYYAGFSEASKTQDFLSGSEYARLYNEAAINVGEPIPYPNVEEQPTADWVDLSLRRGFLQEANANVSGGGASTRYFIAGTMRNEKSFLIDSDFRRYSIQANIDQLIGDQFTLGVSINPSRTEGNRKGNYESPFYKANFWAPNLEPFDENGDPRGGLVCNGVDCYLGTPLNNWTDTWSDIISTQVLMDAYLSYQADPYLSFRLNFSTQYAQSKELFRYGAGTDLGYQIGYGSDFNEEIVNYTWTALGKWEKQLADQHELDITAGFQLTKERLTGLLLDGGVFPDDRLRYIGAAAHLFSHDSFFTEAGFTGWFARANYAFKNRYLLSLVGRYDGSSRFGAGNRYGFFPAVSAGWILSDENFWNPNWINFLKIRSSYGLTGNADIGNFASRGLIEFGKNYNGRPGYSFNTIENNLLGWEKNLQWDAGLELALFNNRIRANLGYYIKDTRDLLLNAPVPGTNGIRQLVQNVGAVRNKGFEFDLGIDVLTGKFEWSIQANGATLKNTVTRLVDNNNDGIEDDIYTQVRFLFRPGESIGTFFLVEFAGVDPDNGDALFWNADKTEKLANQTPSDNRRIVGKSLPDFTGGVNNVFRYKNLQLSAFFQIKTGFQLYWLEGQICGPVSGRTNQLRHCALNAWSPENPNTNIPQGRLNQLNGTQRSSRNLYSGDYLRMANLQLGYTFSKLGKSDHQLQLFLAAQNLFTVTDFPGLDPDSEFYAAGQAEQGAVLGQVPAARTFTMGLNLDFN